MRAIDLYSGVGGWSLGLQMAGIQVVASYEWWDRAATTHRMNLGSEVHEVDIRALDVAAVPTDVDIVVGSPPCTQFSYSNRGGNGDIADGLKDIEKFLEIVDHVQPTYWAMENVPRVANILRHELGRGRSLHRFADLVEEIHVVNMADFGLPQRRRRMVAGRFPLEVLTAYADVLPQRTLGQILDAFADEPVKDPLYDIKLSVSEVTEHEPEARLTTEETRLNREAKAYHPVYNGMQFPDSLEQPARTVTALCTRVSRESIVIDAPEEPGYRRLTVRERATLQGFPITYQFFGNSYSDKLKLVGNALPPLMAYYLGLAMRGVPAESLAGDGTIQCDHHHPPEHPRNTPPPGSVSTYPKKRKFRAAIPHLRFGSGMRFELANRIESDAPSWEVRFYYGSSKRIRSLSLDKALTDRVLDASGANSGIRQILLDAASRWQSVSGDQLQAAWTHREAGPHPHDLVDDMGEVAVLLHNALLDSGDAELCEVVMSLLSPSAAGQRTKLSDNGRWIVAGVLAGSCFNASHGRPHNADR